MSFTAEEHSYLLGLVFAQKEDSIIKRSVEDKLLDEVSRNIAKSALNNKMREPKKLGQLT